MDNFIFALNATMPVFIVILAGKFFIKLGIISESWSSVSNKFAFYVAMPLVLFKDISTMKIDFNQNIKFILYCFFITIIMFILGWIISNIFIKDKTMVGSFAQGSIRGSAAILGLPFVYNIYGNAGMVPLMILASVPLFNAISVVILALGAKSNLDGNKRKIDIKMLMKSIAKNPLIIGILLGFPFCIFQLQLPAIILKPMNTIGNTAVALMLLSLGADFRMGDLSAKFKISAWATSIKLIFLPLVFMPLAVYMGFRGSSLVAILVMLGAPSAISGYVMAKAMDNDHVLMSNIIVMTTLFSSVTFTLWLFVLKSLALI